MLRALFVALALVALASSFPSGTRVSLEAPVTAAPEGWKLLGAAAPEDTLKVYFFLNHPDGAEDQLTEELMAVSDPRSPRYGKHLSFEELRALLFKQEHADVLNVWLRGHGVADVKATEVGDMVEARITSTQASAMFQTTLATFVKDDVKVVRALAYTVPEEIARAVATVGDLVHFPAQPREPIVTDVKTEGRRLLGGGGGGAGTWTNACTGEGGTRCKGLVTPAVLKTRYNIPASPASAAAKSSMAVAEFQGQYYSDADITKFKTGCAVEMSNITDFGKNRQSAGIESMLDIEYIGAVANPIPLQVWYQEEFSLLSWIQKVASTKDAALVHSVSYGNDEIQQTGAAYMNQVNVQFQQIGARGISVLFASGDQGVWGRSGHGSRFHPDFPGASPYITTVGGTDFVTDKIGDEMAWSAGGGGFSDTFAMPSYQSEVVKAYLADSSAKLPPASYFNATGRGYPDVAALGGQKTPYCINAGSFEGVAGTSASCPVVAGVFALLNDHRLAAGKAPLGFLNPFIYQNAAAFNDVQSGKNNAGEGEGFTAIKGWDAASGFGTPDFSKLLAAVKSLP